MKRYLYNFADLLIADEAGQTSPEIAAASFALAKRAVIVGDEYQIPPVWGTSRLLDISLALEAGVIRSAEDFRLLEESGHPFLQKQPALMAEIHENQIQL